MKGDGAAGFSFCVQRPGETVFMEKAVGHCVLTVSGIPREFKDFRTEDVGAVLLSSWVVSSRTDGDEPTLQKSWYFAPGHRTWQATAESKKYKKKRKSTFGRKGSP